MSVPPFEIDVTSDALTRFLAARDGRFAPLPASVEVPLAFFCFLRSQPATGVSIHEALGRDPDRGLFGGVRYDRSAPIAPGDHVRATSRVVDRKTIESPRGTLVVTTLAIDYAVRDERHLVETVRMVDLPPGPPRPAPDVLRESPTLPRIADVGPITRTQIAWMTVETGDMNPLHLDPEYARRRRFRDVVVPGPLLAALIEREVRGVVGKPLASLDVRMRAPSFADETLVLHGAEDGDRLRFGLFAATGDGMQECRVEGTARVD